MEKRVLLVDPDPAFTARAFQAFAEAGVLLEAVADEARALDRVWEVRPDLVVLSERPGGNVFSVCNRLRRAGPRGTPVVLLAADEAGDAVEAHRASPTAADLYLSLELSPQALLEAVEARLGLEPALIDDEEVLSLDEAEEVVEPRPEPDGAVAALDVGGELQPLREQLAEGQQALEELERTVVALQRELQEQRDEAADRESRSAAAEARAKSLSEVLDDALAEREESDRAWTARLAEAEREAAALREEAYLARDEAARARGEAEAARREAVDARAEAEEARAEAEAARIEAIEARAGAEAEHAEVEALRGELSDARAEGEALRDELSRARAEAEEAAAGLASARAALEALEAAPRTDAGMVTVDAEPAALEELARELAEERAERERMQDELAAELAHLAHDLAARDVELGAARRRVAQLENALRALEAERDRLAAAPRPAEAVAGPADELERLRSELEDLRGENVFLGTEVDRYAARLRELQRGTPG